MIQDLITPYSPALHCTDCVLHTCPAICLFICLFGDEGKGSPESQVGSTAHIFQLAMTHFVYCTKAIQKQYHLLKDLSRSWVLWIPVEVLLSTGKLAGCECARNMYFET